MRYAVMAMMAWTLHTPAGAAVVRPAAMPPDTAAVHELWRAIDHHWNARDPQSFAALYTENASFIFVDRRDTLSGRAAILERFEAEFPAMAPDLRHRSTPGPIREAGAGVLAMDGTVEILRVADATRGDVELLRTFAIFALMRADSGALRIDVLRVYEID